MTSQLLPIATDSMLYWWRHSIYRQRLIASYIDDVTATADSDWLQVILITSSYVIKVFDDDLCGLSSQGRWSLLWSFQSDITSKCVEKGSATSHRSVRMCRETIYCQPSVRQCVSRSDLLPAIGPWECVEKWSTANHWFVRVYREVICCQPSVRQRVCREVICH